MQKVVDTIKIEKLEGGAFNVVQGDRYSDTLSYDEMLGLVSALTIATEPNCLRWMQTKEEHDAQFNSLKKAVEDITEVEFEDILVPESIEIYISLNKNFGDNLWIAFNDGYQLLGFNSSTNQWIVSSELTDFYKASCKLIPCNREDLIAGDTAFSCNIGKFDCTELLNYCKVISDLHCVCIGDRDVRIYGTSCLEWYKVVLV